MKPHPRLRKITKWTGALVTVVLAAVWVGSVWWYGRWCATSGYGVVMWRGQLYLAWPVAPGSTDIAPGWHVAHFSPALRWGYEQGGSTLSTWIALPIGPVALSAAIATVGAWRLDMLARRRARVGQCPKCGYDLTGLLADAVCPECNTARPGLPSAPT